MQRFLPDGTVTRGSQLNVRALDRRRACEPPSPANVLARLGVLLLIALCFGLAAQILVGAF
jgi:hypothetical protein